MCIFLGVIKMGLAMHWRNIPNYYEDKGSGKIITYTVLRSSANDPSRENIDINTSSFPMVIAIIETEKREMLTAEIVECRPEDVRIGSIVECCFRKIMEKGEKGIICYGYKFRMAR